MTLLSNDAPSRAATATAQEAKQTPESRRMPSHWGSTTLDRVVSTQRQRITGQVEQAPLTHETRPSMSTAAHRRASLDWAQICNRGRLRSSFVTLPEDSEAHSPRWRRVVCSTESLPSPSNELAIEFLAVLVSSPSFFDAFRDLAQGTTKSRERVATDCATNLLPPFSEQRRIVDLVDRLFLHRW